jgi:hypothetical protein
LPLCYLLLPPKLLVNAETVQGAQKPELSTAAAAAAAVAAVDLKTAGSFEILAKTGISTKPACSVTGDIGVLPIAAEAMTGFSFTGGG